MSRFYGQGSESEDSDTDEGGGITHDVQPASEFTPASTLHRSQFAFDDSDSDSSIGKRVVRTKKERMVQDFRQVTSAMKNHLKINDWVAISKEYEGPLKKALNKWSAEIEKDGVPRSVVRMLVNIEDAIQQAIQEKKAKKRMSPSNARSLSRMKQNFKRDNLHSAERTAYRADDHTQSGSEGSDESSDEDELTDEELTDEEKQSDSEESGEEESSSEEWSSDFEELEPAGGLGDDATGIGVGDMIFGGSDPFGTTGVVPEYQTPEAAPSDAESEEEPGDETALTAQQMVLSARERKMRNRNFWVKTKKQKPKPKPSRARPTPGITPTPPPRVPAKPAPQQKVKEYTVEVIKKLLVKHESQRGRHKIEPSKAVEELEKMLAKCPDELPELKVKVAIVMLGSLFDCNLNKAQYLALNLWNRCVEVVLYVIKLLTENGDVRLEEEIVAEDDDTEEAEDDIDRAIRERDQKEEKKHQYEKKEGKDQPDGVREMTIKGNVFAYVQRLNTEYKRSLQLIDFNDVKYQERREDLPKLSDLIAKVRAYYQTIGNIPTETRLALIQLGHIYDVYDPTQDAYNPNIRQPPQKLGKHGPSPILDSPEDEASHLCGFIYQHGDARQKTHALLMRVTNYAIHNRYFHARDMLLMSHLNETIGQTDVATRILFNRTQAHLALCAFRHGFFRESMRICAELYQTGHIKECLGQGVSTTRWNERDPKQEIIEKKREYPSHQHINLDLLESAHLISAMFLETPNLAQSDTSDRRHVISRNFRRLWDQREKSPFAGPPENTRDYIMAAAKAMSFGEWKQCQDHVGSLKMWAICSNATEVRDMLFRKIQEVALETYLLTYGPRYVSLSLKHLSKMFDLSEKDVHRLVSSVLVENTTLRGNWDQPSQTISIFSKNPNPLQQRALEFADKISMLVDNNEKVLEFRIGGGRYYTRRSTHAPPSGGRGRGGRGGRGRGGGRGGGRGRGGFQGRKFPHSSDRRHA